MSTLNPVSAVSVVKSHINQQDRYVFYNNYYIDLEEVTQLLEELGRRDMSIKDILEMAQS